MAEKHPSNLERHYTDIYCTVVIEGFVNILPMLWHWCDIYSSRFNAGVFLLHMIIRIIGTSCKGNNNECIQECNLKIA